MFSIEGYGDRKEAYYYGNQVMSIHWDPGLAFTAGSEEALRAGCLHGCVWSPELGGGLGMWGRTEVPDRSSLRIRMGEGRGNILVPVGPGETCPL